MARPKPKDDSYYTCSKVAPTEHKITKFDADSVYQNDYAIIETRPKQFYCTCPGFAHHSHCRHLDIFKRFQNEDLIGQGYAYSFRHGAFSATLDALV